MKLPGSFSRNKLPSVFYITFPRYIMTSLNLPCSKSISDIINKFLMLSSPTSLRIILNLLLAYSNWRFISSLKSLRCMVL